MTKYVALTPSLFLSMPPFRGSSHRLPICPIASPSSSVCFRATPSHPLSTRTCAYNPADILPAKLRTQIAQLKSQLAERPTLEAVQELRKEYTNLEILLDGTQRENERCMAELERCAPPSFSCTTY